VHVYAKANTMLRHGPALHLMCLPASVLADGVYWEEPLTGDRAGVRPGQRRNGRAPSQGRKGKLRQVGKEATTTSCNSAVVPSNLIGPYDRKYKDRSKVVPRKNGRKHGSK